MNEPEVTVIIPTLGDDRRAQTIWRAIESVGPRSGASTRIIVVVNGNRFSQALVTQLQATMTVEYAYVEAGSLPLAICHGRRLVATEFFAFLDDDDEILENGLRVRQDVLRNEPGVAFVVTNGWRTDSAGDELQVKLKADAIEADPFRSMLSQNWIASASGLYRTSAVSTEDFTAMPSYLEWTYVGFRLAARSFRFLDRPTYRVYDLPGSVSKSHAYRAGMIPALQCILQLQLPRHARVGLRRKLGVEHHTLSSSFLDERSLARAWKHHCLSLGYPGGWRYTLYTRKLFRLPLLGHTPQDTADTSGWRHADRLPGTDALRNSSDQTRLATSTMSSSLPLPPVDSSHSRATAAAPRVSIGLPVFNGMPFLPATLDALTKQTYQSWELVICDNASTDDTEPVCRGYAARDSRIRYYRSERNVGLAKNFQRVVGLSSGTYFKLASHDDLCAPTLVERCIETLDAHPEAVLCYAQTTLIDERGDLLGLYDDDLALHSSDPVERFAAILALLGLVNVLYGIVRLDSLRRTGLHGNFPGADEVLVAELSLHGQFLEIPQRLFFRRLHSAASSGLTSVDALQQFMDPDAPLAASMRYIRKYPAYMRAIARSPLRLSQKITLGGIVARRALWHRGFLWKEVVATSRRFARQRRNN